MKSQDVKIHRLKPVFKDTRGLIYDVIESPVEHIGMITFTKGAIRGNHYHKKSTQYTLVLKGKIELITCEARRQKGMQRRTIMRAGDLAIIPPRIIHTYHALTPASIIDCATRSRRAHGYEEDTIRVPPLS